MTTVATTKEVRDIVFELKGCLEHDLPPALGTLSEAIKILEDYINVLWNIDNDPI